MKKFLLAFLLLLFLSWTNLLTVLAQSEGKLQLSLSREFGYSSGTGQIQGRFTMRASGPDDLVKVAFLIDGQIIAEDTEPPFSVQFHTGDYSLGVHTIHATGYTASGTELQSNEIRQEFVAAEEGVQTALRIVLPILGVTFAAIIIGFLFPMLTGGKRGASLPLGAPRSYGVLGGAICPKCGRPFGVHIWGLNLMVGKLDRCPHCGRWSLVRRASLDALKAAEAAELEGKVSSEASLMPSKERQRKDLDESRFTDL